MFTRNIPDTNASPLVEEITQHGVQFPDGTMLFEDIEAGANSYFRPKWQNTPMVYYIGEEYDNRNMRNFEALRKHYVEHMKALGIEADLIRVKRTITLVVLTATEAP